MTLEECRGWLKEGFSPECAELILQLAENPVDGGYGNRFLERMLQGAADQINIEAELEACASKVPSSLVDDVFDVFKATARAELQAIIGPR